MIPKEFFYRYQKFDQIFHFLLYLPHLSSPQHKWKLEFVKNSVVFSLSIDVILKIFFNHSYLLYKQGYTHLSYCNFYLSKKKKKKQTRVHTEECGSLLWPLLDCTLWQWVLQLIELISIIRPMISFFMHLRCDLHFLYHPFMNYSIFWFQIWYTEAHQASIQMAALKLLPFSWEMPHFTSSSYLC